MDHWSNLNLNQTYGRISSAGSLPSNAATLTPFDLQNVIDQRGFNADSLGAGLANPLPAHGRFPSLTHINYAGIPLFETMSQLGTTIPTQTSYKPTMQTVYRLDTLAQRQPSLMQPIHVSMQIKTSANEQNFVSDGIVGTSDSKPWNRNNIVQSLATTNPYSGLPNEVSRSFSIKNDVKEPPPAHSGNRPSTIQRTPYKPQPTVGQLTASNPTGNSIRTQIPISNLVTQRLLNDAAPPTAHINNMQKITDANLVQRLILSGQQFNVDNTLDPNVIKSFPAVLQQVNQIYQAHATSKGPTTITSSANNKINLPVYQSQQQQSMYNSSLFASGQNSTLLSYAQAVADGTAASYDAISSPENDCLNSNNAYLGGMLLANENGKLIQLQPTQIEIPGNVDAVQAIADSTTKPKRGGRGGKAATKITSQIALIGDNQLVLLNEDPDKNKKGKGKKGTAGQQRTQDANNTVNMLLSKGYCQGLIGSFGQFVPAFNTEGGEIQYTDTSFLQQRPGETYQIIQTDNGTTTLDACSYNKIQQQQQDNNQHQVFLTNIFGNSFVNPNEVLPIDETLSTFLTVDQDQLQGDVIEYLNQQKIKLKEEKEIRSADEEFCHLVPASSAPTSLESSPIKLIETVPPVVSTAPSKPAGFLDCFLSFVQGKKQETLASMSNIPITNKPVLPKYIPDTRPRRVEEPPKLNLDLTKECALERNPFITNEAVKERGVPKVVYDSFGLVKRGRGRPRLRPDDPEPKRSKVERPNRQIKIRTKMKEKVESEDSEKEVTNNLLDSDSDDDPAWKPGSKKDLSLRKSNIFEAGISDTERKKKKVPTASLR